MNWRKKYTAIGFLVFGFLLIFSFNNNVKAEDTEITIQYNEDINSEKLEEIRTSKFKVLLTPRTKVEAIPTQEDVSKYYYNQLKHDVSRNTYNELKSQVNNKVTIGLNNLEYSLNQITNTEIANCFKENLLQYVMDGYEAYIMDGATNYWWTSDVKIGEIRADVSNNKAVFKTVEIISNLDEWSDYANFNKELKEVSNSIKGNSVYEIARSINHYICNSVEYTIIDDTYIEQTSYGALIVKKAVCEGQTQLFNLLCREKGLLSINVYGFTNENNVSTAHAWNYVYEPSKKQWYAIDVTWNNYYNDPAYFMLGSNTEIKGVKFGKNHIAGFKQYTVQTYIPSTPVLSSERYIDAITIDGAYIKNIQPNTEYNEFLKEFSNDIQFIVKEGDTVVTGTNKIKTGQVLTVGENNYTLVVIGDTNGDGKADIKDILKVNKHRLNKIKLQNEYFKAGDVNKDGKADIRDILKINKYRLKKINEM